MRFPMEREHMMLAGGKELDVAQQHHFVVLFRLELSDKHILRALRITPVEFLPGTHNPVGGLLQSFAIRIFSDTAQNFANQFFGINDRKVAWRGRLFRYRRNRWRSTVSVPGAARFTIKTRDDGS